MGTRNNIMINENEMNQLIMQAAQQYRPEDRQKFVEYVRNEPMAAAQLRAPLFEDKVVDFLFAKAEISERTVSREALQAEIESTDGGPNSGHVHGPDCDHDHDHDHDHGHATKAKKPAAKKAKAEAAPADTGEPEAKPAKKGKAKKAEAEEATPADATPAEEAPAAEAPVKKGKPKKAETAEAAPADEAPAKKPKAKKKDA
jgi:trigger factor